MAKKNEGKDPRGRLESMTPEKMDEMRKFFLAGYTDEQACFSVGVSTSAFYRWLEKNKDFREWKEVAKKNPAMLAKLNLYACLKKADKDVSKFILERTEKENYSPRSEHTGAGGQPIQIIDSIPDDRK